MKVFLRSLFWCCMMSIGSIESVSNTRDVIAATHARGPLGESYSFRFAAGSDPIINRLPISEDFQPEEGPDENVVPGGSKKLTFFLPYARIKAKSAQQFINQMNSTAHSSYKITLHPTDLPMKGLLCEVELDPSEHGFQLETFVSPKGEPGVKFTFHDKKALGMAVTRADTILKTAYLSAPAHTVKKKYA